MSGITASAEAARPLPARTPLVPVHRDLLADMLTPVRAYALLCAPDSPGFLLESVEGGERLARYSFIGHKPVALDLGQGDPLIALRHVASEPVLDAPQMPRFLGGAVGYLGWESARHFERLPQAAGPGPPLPESAFLRTESLAIFDHVLQRLRLITLHRTDREDRSAAERRLDEMEAKLAAEPPMPPAKPGARQEAWTSNLGQQRYERMVGAARAHILAGDAFQIVLSQRFRKPLAARPFDVYRCLRGVNPSPYMFFVAFGGGRYIVGTSPEVLVRVEAGEITTRPLAGTRRRDLDPAHDEALERELLTDQKERAEHVMLVDLGRNDVGRVAAPGSVRVPRLMEVERYSHVMHISSTVTGRLARGQDSLAAVRATFPAGTLSGAPKIRAMEIIAELEPERRGPYGGALGYVGFGGNLDLAITLRSIVIADGIAYVQSGAGIVADSEPPREHQETLDKAGAMFAAVERAEAMP